jgi:hypothetical protein
VTGEDALRDVFRPDKGEKAMKKFTMRALLFGAILLVTGCATSLTPGGQKIKVLRDDDQEKVAGCVRLAQVTGESASLLSGGEYGLYYATADARNKAAVIKGADTLLITRTQPSNFGGAIEGIVYNCLSPHVAEAAPEPPRKARQAPVAPPAATTAPATVTNDIFVKAKKCQERGGVWVNSQCVIQID